MCKTKCMKRPIVQNPSGRVWIITYLLYQYEMPGITTSPPVFSNRLINNKKFIPEVLYSIVFKIKSVLLVKCTNSDVFTNENRLFYHKQMHFFLYCERVAYSISINLLLDRLLCRLIEAEPPLIRRYVIPSYRLRFMLLPRQTRDSANPKKIRSTDDFGLTEFTVYVL